MLVVDSGINNRYDDFTAANVRYAPSLRRINISVSRSAALACIVHIPEFAEPRVIRNYR